MLANDTAKQKTLLEQVRGFLFELENEVLLSRQRLLEKALDLRLSVDRAIEELQH